MKTLFLFITLCFTFSSVTTFDNSSYIDDERVVEMLDFQFVKDMESSTLYSNVENFLSNYLDEVSHISGHYALETNLYYYTVYGKKDGINTFEMLEVSQKLFENSAYYQISTVLMGTCRRGNGWPSYPVCQGYCQIRTNGCLGIICPPGECFG